MKKILLVEDNETIILGLKYTLEQERFEVDIAKNVVSAKAKINKEEYNLFLLDISLPDGEGYEICKQIKQNENNPVIFLTAKDEEKDIVQGLDMGADDYVAKPYNPAELAARVKSQLRRYTCLGGIDASLADRIMNGRLEYHIDGHVLYADGVPVRLTATETKIIDLLMNNLGRIFPAEEIYERVWEEPGFASENTVMVHIRRIREKIELNPKEPEYLKVVWGIGYKMEKMER